MRLRDLLAWSGRLGLPAYAITVITMVVGFIVLAIMLPTFTVMALPISYVAFCLLTNRLRDAGIPAIFACTPFQIVLVTLLLYIIASFQTLGGGGSGSGGSAAARNFYRQVESFSNDGLGWVVATIYLVAGLLPGRSLQAEPT